MSDALFIPEISRFGELDRMTAQRSGTDELSVEMCGPQPLIRKIAARMMIGQLYAMLDNMPIKLLRFTVVNQGAPGRLVFSARFRPRDIESAARPRSAPCQQAALAD